MAIQEQRHGGSGSQQPTGVSLLAPPGERQGTDERRATELHNGKAERLAPALGWFSIGLGLAEVVAPRGIAKLIGVSADSGNRTLLCAVGLREIASGLGILTRPRPTGWLYTRVAGDAMDLALLGAALRSNNARRGRVAAATAAVVGVTALDLLCSVRLSRRPGTTTSSTLTHRTIRVQKSITVSRPPEEVYRFWHDFQNLPRFMHHLVSVQVTGERRLHWVAKAPGGKTVEWDAEIIDDRPNERIAWRSLAGADVDNSGSVRFERAPGGRGTEVRVEMQYSPPGGVIGATIAKLFGEAPEQQVQEDLRRFKQVMEAGEIAISEGQLSGRARPPREVTPHHTP
jgi:uncharacterized membrane protein